MARGKRLEDLVPLAADDDDNDRDAADAEAVAAMGSCAGGWRLPDDLNDDAYWPLPEPEILSDPSPALPPAPVVAGSRYPPPVAAAIDRLLEIRSEADGDLDSVARIDRALVTLSQAEG